MYVGFYRSGFLLFDIFFLIKDSLSEDIKVSITLMVSRLCCGKYNVIRDNMLANIMLNVVELYVLREY